MYPGSNLDRKEAGSGVVHVRQEARQFSQHYLFRDDYLIFYSKDKSKRCTSESYEVIGRDSLFTMQSLL